MILSPTLTNFFPPGSGAKYAVPIIGDVRGIGLFLGVEIITNIQTKEPGTLEAEYICNRLREKRILVGLEGPYDNVIKIRPPLCVDKDDINTFLKFFSNILEETFLKLSLIHI